jgi:hypothetical protein
MAHPFPLGRRPSEDDSHIKAFPLTGALAETPVEVNRVLRLPLWHWTHDQGHEGSCVGHATAMSQAIINTQQNVLLQRLGFKTVRYDPISIWNAGKEVDEWPDTNPGDDNGTSVRAAYDVLRDKGARKVKSMELTDGIPTPVKLQDWDIQEGILTNRWATTVDELRACLGAGIPVTIGINWYRLFDEPTQRADGHFYLTDDNADFGKPRGGHAVSLYGASDRRQAFRLKNSWGRSYPLVWLPYSTMGRLLNEDGEATLVTDR